MNVRNLIMYLKDPLYRNSLFLTLGKFFNVSSGFIFWIVAAKFYSVEEVGVATALLSSLYIITTFSRFGFDFSIIRFVHINDKNKVFNTSFSVTTIVATIVGIIYILRINSFSPGLGFIQTPWYATLFLFFVILSSIVSITGVAFTAVRKADQYFYQNMLLVSRIPLLIPLVFLKGFGIFGSVGLAYLISTLFALLNLSKYIKLDFKMDYQFIRDSFSFSSRNYALSVFSVVPGLVLPILVFSLLGEAAAARYYIAFAIGNLVLIIPDALCTSLFVEGSHGEGLRKTFIKTGLTVYAFLIPMVVFIYFFGDHLLALVGKDYVEAFSLLRLLILSSFFVSVYSLFVSIQQVRMKVESIVKLNFLLLLLLLGLSYFFIPRFGIMGVGYAWMITYCILDLLVLVLIKRIGWTSPFQDVLRSA